MAKRITQFLFIIKLMFIGFCLGMIMAAIMMKREDGFIPAGIALVYGLSGMITGLAGAVYMIRKMEQKTFRAAVLIAGAVALALLVGIMIRIKSVKEEEKKKEYPVNDASDKVMSEEAGTFSAIKKYGRVGKTIDLDYGIPFGNKRSKEELITASA